MPLAEVRSYSVALFLMAKGHRPLDCGFTPNGTLVFTFSPAATEGMDEYHESRAHLNELEIHARRLRSQREGM
jgi:hypothetical protein